MASLNRIFLIGNLTRDPELRYAPSGTAVASFGMATNREFTSQSGEKKKETCFVRIVVWGKQAEACNQYLKKGRLVFVEGRLQYRAWEGTDGQKKSTLEVRADRVQFLSSGQGRAESQDQEVPMPDMAENAYAGSGSDSPQAPKKAQNEPFLPEDDAQLQDERDLT